MAKRIDYSKLYTLRRDGRYMATYTDETGRHSLYDKDPYQLHLKLELAKQPKAKPPARFRDIAQSWYESNWSSIEDGTRSSYKAPYNRAVERFGDWLAADIMPRDIGNHLSLLKDQGLSRSTLKIQRTVYSIIYQAAIINPQFEREILRNPAADAKLPSGLPPAEIREAPEDDVLEAIQNKAGDAYWGLFALFVLCTGFRRGEALAVKWENVDFRAETISCHSQITGRSGVSVEKKTKTVKGIRTVPILGPLKKHLKQPADARPTDYIFPGEDSGKPMPVSTYDRRWLHYCKDMGFVEDTPEPRISTQGKHYIKHNYRPTLTAHELRHGYATILFEADVDVYTAQKLLGHAHITTTMAIYTHLRNKKKAKSMDKLKEYTKEGF